jgi:diguanylate cyclase (GGDEF)-like protein
VFALAWCALITITLAAAVLLGGTSTRAGAFFAAAAAGEVALGLVTAFLLERTVFRPVHRLREAVATSDVNTVAAERGPLAPLAEAISDRMDRSVATLREAVRDREERLEQVDRLRRALEETRRNLESSVQYLRKLGLNDFCIMLYSREQKRLVVRASAGGSHDSGASAFTLAPGDGIAGKVFSTGEPAWVPDVRSFPEFQYYGGTRKDVRSFLCVPLTSKGKSIGVLMLNHPEPNAFEPEILPTMRVLASYLAIAIENAELFGFVKSLAEKDSLTLLYNHGAFHEKLAIELERANRYGRPMSVIMLDLDGFKEINDRYGHMTGDRVLALVAGALGAHLRKTDIAARYGGDEFAVILPETDLPAAATIAGRIAEGISGVRLDADRETVISFTASIGYATCAPDSAERGQILAIADRLMYESKRRGHGGVLGMGI